MKDIYIYIYISIPFFIIYGIIEILWWIKFLFGGDDW